jgi:putative FmdB family regulatory protein
MSRSYCRLFIKAEEAGEWKMAKVGSTLGPPSTLLAVNTPMPTYEYACKQCGQNFEIFQSFSDKPLKKHEECGGDLQKVFHARGIVFKGSGFYATDSKGSSGGSKESTAPTNNKSAKSSSKKETKTKASSSKES